MQLENSGWRLELCPEAGGVALSLSRHGVDILRPTPSIDTVRQDPRLAAHYPCVPWFNRLFGGFDFADRHWPLRPICDPEAALHGEGWARPWHVAEALPDRARLRLDYRSGEPGRFPFAFAAEQQFNLTNEQARITLRVRNEHDAPAPFGLALHPFFRRSRDTRLDFNSTGLCTAATARSSDTWLQSWSQGDARRLPDETIDHSFAGFGGEVVISGAGCALRLTSDAPFLHVYAPAGEDFFCLEPATHPMGGFGNRVLAPGETLSLRLDLHAS